MIAHKKYEVTSELAGPEEVTAHDYFGVCPVASGDGVYCTITVCCGSSFSPCFLSLGMHVNAGQGFSPVSSCMLTLLDGGVRDEPSRLAFRERYLAD